MDLTFSNIREKRGGAGVKFGFSTDACPTETRDELGCPSLDPCKRPLPFSKRNIFLRIFALLLAPLLASLLAPLLAPLFTTAFLIRQSSSGTRKLVKFRNSLLSFASSSESSSRGRTDPSDSSSSIRGAAAHRRQRRSRPARSDSLLLLALPAQVGF